MEKKTKVFHVNDSVNELTMLTIDVTEDPPELVYYLLSKNVADNYANDQSLKASVLHPFIFTRYTRSNKT